MERKLRRHRLVLSCLRSTRKSKLSAVETVLVIHLLTRKREHPKKKIDKTVSSVAQEELCCMNCSYRATQKLLKLQLNERMYKEAGGVMKQNSRILKIIQFVMDRM